MDADASLLRLLLLLLTMFDGDVLQDRV